MPQDGERALLWLSRYRTMRELRDPVICWAAREGKSYRQIARAAGMGKTRVWRIVNTETKVSDKGTAA